MNNPKQKNQTINDFFEALPLELRQTIPFNFTKAKPFPVLNRVANSYGMSKTYRGQHRCYHFYKPISKIYK